MKADLVVYDRYGKIILIAEIKKKKGFLLNGQPNGDATCFLMVGCQMQIFL